MTEALIERECTIQVRKWRESRGELTHQPGRRLHGTRAIFEQKHRAAAISSGGSLSFLASHIPAPGPLRASSSLLSLTGLRKSKSPFYSQTKKERDAFPLQPLGGGIAIVTTESSSGTTHSKPPISPPYNAGAGGRAQVPRGPSPLATTSSATTAPAPTAHVSSAHTLQPTPKVVSEQITHTLPSPTANNSPLPPCPETVKPTTAGAAEEDGKKKKKSKEDKKREKEEEKQKLREKKEKERMEKERLRKEKEKAEKEKKKDKGGKKKDKGGGESEEKNGAAAAKDLA